VGKMRVIITAGGTGGHIYPAIAIANKIKEKDPKSEILYIGTHNRMEKNIVPKFGYQYEEIEIYGFTKNIKTNLINIKLVIKAKQKCLKIMEKFKPDVVVGVGGYVTYPVIKAAKKLKIKTFIHEQNSIPGKSNRMLAKDATKIGVSFIDSIKYFKYPEKCILTGNPCGENAIDAKAISKTKYGLKPKKQSILMVQGSLGSSSMNNKMEDFLTSIENEPYEVLYVTGKNLYESFAKNKFSKNVYLVPYIENLAALMKDFDLVVTRAGASIISEILALQKPNILIPSPYVANNHQYYNALSIVNIGAGLMIEEKDFNVDILKEKIDKILFNPKYYAQMQSNMLEMSINNSSTIIYEIIKELSQK